MKWGRTQQSLMWVLIVVWLASVSACSGRNQPAEAPAPAPVPTNQVAVSASSFDPPNALVTAGMAVTWTNLDGVSYLITDNGDTFAFNLPAGGVLSVDFTDPGTYDYHCSGHPGIQGTITVVRGTLARMSGAGFVVLRDSPGTSRKP
jgi:plastocyanin